MNSHSSRIAPELLVFSSRAESASGSRAEDPSVEQPTDEAILSLIKAGERDFLGRLFKRYARLVRGIARRILQDTAEVDDVVQEVFLYVYRRCQLYDPLKGSARGWLVQVAYTQALLRRRQLNSRRSTSFEALAIDPQRGPEDRGGEQYGCPLESLFGRNGWKKAWDDLGECQRETLRLHFYEGCTFAEIAEKLGQSYVNIRHHYYRGLEKLRQHARENDLNWP